MSTRTGWLTVLSAAIIILGTVASIFFVNGFHSESLQLLVRVSARYSAILFSIAFALPGLAALMYPTSSVAHARYERYFFLSFVISHLVHLLTLFTLASVYPKIFFADFQWTPVLLGGFVYLMIFTIGYGALMGKDRQYQLLKVIEKVGLNVIWVAFALAYFTRFLSGVLYGVIACIVMLAMVLRWLPIVFRLQHESG